MVGAYTRDIRENSPLLPTQMTQRDWGTFSDKETYTFLHHTYDDDSNLDDLSTSKRGLSGGRPQQPYRFSSWPISLLWLLCIFASAFFVTLLHIFSRPSIYTSIPPSDQDDYDNGAPFAPFATQRLWAAYSPYHSVEKYKLPPEDCQLTQVNILQRHGARFPTSGQAVHIAQAVQRLQAAESHADRRLRFLANYTYELGVADLVHYGQIQSFEAGRKTFSRYPKLANESNLPFVRSSGGARVVESALQWVEGFAAGSDDILITPVSVIIPEHNGHNNTLDNGSCPNVKHSSAEVKEWQSIYAKPIADRLNSGARGLPEKLTAEDAHSLVLLCALETVAKEEYSPFCDLFTRAEFEGFEYAFDLDKFYFTGHGSRLGPVQGVGYINELLARLTNQPVQDRTQTNRTLDSNPDTFPFERGIYADFSHDNQIVAVISAMGLFKEDTDDYFSIDGAIMDPKKPNEDRLWVTSKIVPFSGRLVVERMECGLPVSETSGGVADRRKKLRKERQRRREQEGGEGSVYVRVLMNDAVQDIGFCEGVDMDGLCPLQEFVKSQEYARENGKGDWEKCFE